MYKLFIFVLILLTGSYAYAGDSEPEKKNDPIEIFSDALHYFPNENKSIFTGKVKSKQNNLSIDCDKMVVFFEKKDFKLTSNSIGAQSSKIKQINVYGNVILTTPKEQAEAERGEYIMETGVTTLYGNVKLFQGQSKLYGDKLVYNNDTGESIMYSENKANRVKGVFISEVPQDGR